MALGRDSWLDRETITFWIDQHLGCRTITSIVRSENLPLFTPENAGEGDLTSHRKRWKPWVFQEFPAIETVPKSTTLFAAFQASPPSPRGEVGVLGRHPLLHWQPLIHSSPRGSNPHALAPARAAQALSQLVLGEL